MDGILPRSVERRDLTEYPLTGILVCEANASPRSERIDPYQTPNNRRPKAYWPMILNFAIGLTPPGT